MIVCEDETASVLVVNVAVSGVLPLRLPVPMALPPSLNVTTPVGVPTPAPAAFTVAVNVTLCPNTDALGDDVTVVVVLAGLTVCTMLPLLVVKFVSPL